MSASAYIRELYEDLAGSRLARLAFPLILAAMPAYSQQTDRDLARYDNKSARSAVYKPQGAPVPQDTSINASAIADDGVVSAASFQKQDISPGSLVSIFGTNLAPCTSLAQSMPYPTKMCGGTVSVLVNGQETPIYYTSSGQLNVFLPMTTPTGTLDVQVKNGTNTTSDYYTQASTYAPALFNTNGNGTAQKFPAYSLVDVTNPIKSGDIGIFWLTGAGPAEGQSQGVTLLRPLTLCMGDTNGMFNPQQHIYTAQSGYPGVAQSAHTILSNTATGIYPIFLSYDNCVSGSKQEDLPYLGSNASSWMTGRLVGQAGKNITLTVNGLPVAIRTAPSGRFMAEYPK